MIDLNGFAIDLTLAASLDTAWLPLPLKQRDGPDRFAGTSCGVAVELDLTPVGDDRIDFVLRLRSERRTRLRLTLTVPEFKDPFHLIPGILHGDNNAAHVRPGEFPCLSTLRPGDRACAKLWEFRADRASHPVALLCGDQGVVAASVDPYADSDETDDGILRQGVFAALPNSVGVSLGYGNDPLTFANKTVLTAATADLIRTGEARGTLYAFRGPGRQAAHRVIRAVYERHREQPTPRRSEREAFQALAETFATVNYAPELSQYTNRKCRVPTDTTLRPWRAIVEIGWTGGAMLAYPFLLADRLIPNFAMPKSGAKLLDEICTGHNPVSGFIDDTCVNAFTTNRPAGWNESTINGWWSGFIGQTRDAHCAYTNAHAAYYLLRSAQLVGGRADWTAAALRVLDSAVRLQRDDGAFGYVFSRTERRVVDWEGFAGCWFAAALARATAVTGDRRWQEAAARALNYYHPFVRDLTAWGSPMDTCKSVDSEGNLAFVRAARLMHELTGDEQYISMLADGAHYEYLWRLGFRARPQAPPLQGSGWNSCGGSITSVSNPHLHPMSVVVTADLEYLAARTGDRYHQDRADDGVSWLLNTMDLYPDMVGYGRYGLLSERTCPSDGLLEETYEDTGRPSSCWWSYNAWAAGSAMEALGERIRGERTR